MTPEEMREMFGNADPFSDFFHTFFGGSMGATDDEPRGRQGTLLARFEQRRSIVSIYWP